MDNTSAEAAFLEAVKSGSGSLVLAPGVSVNCKDASGNTALHIACYEDLPRVAGRLIRLGANILAPGSKGFTALHAAAQLGSAPLVRLLLQSLSSDDRRSVKLLGDNNGDTVLHVATFNGHMDIVKLFLTEQCWDPNLKNSKEQTCLHLACLGGHVDIVKLLVAKRNSLSLQQSCATASLLMSFEHLSGQIFKCDVNSMDSFGKTPAHYACEQGHVGVARVLHDCGADMTSRDTSGNACLHLAASNGHRSVVNFLVGECEADPNSKGSEAEAALHSASRNGHDEVVRDLLHAHRCDAFARDVTSHTPLHLAAKFGRSRAVEELIAKCPVDVLDANRNTPLHLACEEGHVSTIRALIQGGSSVEAINAYGITPLQTAAMSCRQDAVEVLVSEFGCDRSTIDPIHLLLKADDRLHEASSQTSHDPVSRERVIGVFGYAAIIDGLLQAQRHAIEQARKMKTLVTHNAQLCNEIADLRRKCNKYHSELENHHSMLLEKNKHIQDLQKFLNGLGKDEGVKDILLRHYSKEKSNTQSMMDSTVDKITPDERPTLRILEYLPVSDWYGLGLQLDIDANQLDAISHTFKDDFKECKRQMFQIWLCMALNASYGELVKALDKIGESSAAALLHVQDKHGKMNAQHRKTV